MIYHMPSELQKMIASLSAGLSTQQLTAMSQQLSHLYRTEKNKQTTKQQKIAYLLARLPATYAACYRVLLEVQQRNIFPSMKSIADFGAGPGGVAWAAAQLFLLDTITSVECDQDWIDIGRHFTKNCSIPAVQNCLWLRSDIAKALSCNMHDVVFCSYSVGELTRKEIDVLIENCWKHSREGIVLIEPGTPKGFENIRYMRQMFLQKGGVSAAPCTHTKQCPMKEGDWCHFSQRLERSALHKQMKTAQLSYEDEKFSYLVITKDKKERDEKQGRVLRHPIKNKGHVILQICKSGLNTHQTITKSEKERYPIAKKVEWGDVWS